MKIIDRVAERRLLEAVLRDVRSGDSRVLVVHGDPGVGKSALLEYLIEQASGCRLIRACGVESEMELAYAALQQLCVSMLSRLGDLPAPQRDALSTAFGLSVGPAPDRLLIGLAVLSLLSDEAEDRPLVCVVDDVQWLDGASAQVLGFLARRLGAESVALIMATRELDSDMTKLPTMHVAGLPEADARALLDAVWTSPLDAQVRDRIIAEARGNPLALLEIPRDLAEYEVAAGFGMPSAVRLSGRIEESFQRRLESLPEQTRRLLLIAAAEPTGDPRLVWRAAERFGIDIGAAGLAVLDGLAELGHRVRFRHPLVRSASYRSAPVRERQLVHHALAEVTDAVSDPDRRAWHRAHATHGPDEDVAAELERSADRAQARGGLAAAAAFLERATTLTLEPSLRAARALAAASAKLHAGAFDAAADLLAVAESAGLTDSQGAHVDLIRAQTAYVTGRGSQAPPLLLKAAQRLETIDPALSRTTYLNALEAAFFAGRLAAGVGLAEVAHAARTAPAPPRQRVSDLVLDGFVAHFTGGYAAGLPILRRAIDTAGGGSAPDERPQFMLAVAATHLWDDQGLESITARQLELVRKAGAMTQLPLALSARARALLYVGDLAGAESAIREAQTITQATGDRFATSALMVLHAFRGNQTALAALIDADMTNVLERGEGSWLTVSEYAGALINNATGNHTAALPLARRAAEQPDLATPLRAAVEFVEAAARCGDMMLATRALSELTSATTAAGTDWALGVEARSRALLADGADAEHLYSQGVELSSRSRMWTELARAHLLYGEWLRRERRRKDARAQLRIAYDMFDAMEMRAFAERARRELLATGETGGKRPSAPSGPQLTAQESQVARMAAEGLTNPEIGARLFISPKTVQYHLSKVFTKLGISSRNQLPQPL